MVGPADREGQGAPARARADTLTGVIQLEESIEVARPADAVYAVLATVERYPDWLPGVTAAEQTSPGPVGEGTTFRLRLAGPGGPLEANGVVVAADPGRSLALRGEASQGRVEGELELEPVDGGTRITVGMEVALSGMYAFAEGLVAGGLRNAMPNALRRIRDRLEAEIPA
jgi:carbon monoxide dehydrogenase subunit G